MMYHQNANGNVVLKSPSAINLAIVIGFPCEEAATSAAHNKECVCTWFLGFSVENMHKNGWGLWNGSLKFIRSIRLLE
jgi:hypothetical protein